MWTSQSGKWGGPPFRAPGSRLRNGPKKFMLEASQRTPSGVRNEPVLVGSPNEGKIGDGLFGGHLLSTSKILQELVTLGVDSPFFSTIVLFTKQPFSLGFWRFSRKKDPWKEWGRYPWSHRSSPNQKLLSGGSPLNRSPQDGGANKGNGSEPLY